MSLITCKLRHILAATVLLITTVFTQAGDLSKLNFVTESYPPYNFKDGSKLQGIAVDLLTAASKEAGDAISAKNIRVLPWPRAYKMATDGPNIVLFSTTRTEQREPLFQWVGPISATRVVLLSRKKDNIKINSAADIKKYTVGAIRDDIGEQLVKELGVTDKSIKKVPGADSLAKMLDKGRIQLWAYEENVARWFIKQGGMNNADFDTAYVLKESELYYTFSKDISSDKVQMLQKGIDAVRGNDAKYQAILKKYL